MISKEEYKKTLVRMYDSLRICHKGELNCDGVGCRRCPLASVCRYPHCNVLISNAFECIELVEKWAKEHPIETNGSRFLKNHPNAEVYKYEYDSEEDGYNHGFVYVKLDASNPSFNGVEDCAKIPITWWESEVDNADCD